MDPASCVITIVETAFSLAQYIKTVYKGHQERHQLNCEVLAVYQAFSALQDQFASDGKAADTAWAGPIRPLLAHGGTIDLLRETLESITKRLTVPEQERVKRAIRALKWPFDRDENKRLTERINSLMQIVNTAYSQANLELNRDTNLGVTHVMRIVDAQAFNNTLEWISVLDYKALQESDQKRPVKGTGSWFLESAPYRNWTQGLFPVLWCHGIPGAGKTLLASAAYDHLRDLLKDENVLLLIVFCQFDEERSYLALEVLSAMLRQALLRKLESLEPRPYLMVTSRPLPEIKDWFTTQADPLGFHIGEDDVDNEELPQYRFLIAKFQMNVLSDQMSVKHVVETLRKLPQEIDGTYERVFQRIDRTEIRERLRLLLSVIVSARTLLTTAALGHAVAMVDAPTNREDLEESIPEMKSLVSLCAGLVDIDGKGFVMLAHETVGEYLKQNSQENHRHAVLARLCMDYLQLEALTDGRCIGSDPYQALETRKHDYPFLSYATLNWGYHVSKAEDSEISRFALQLLSLESNTEAMAQMMWHDGPNWDAERGATGLHLAAHHGLVNATSQLLASGADVDARDCLGTTPLMYAAAAGHSKIVEILLHSGAEPAAICDRGATALHRACYNEHAEVVRQLVESPKDTTVNALDERCSGQSALILAIEAIPAILRLILTRKDLLVNQLVSNPERATVLYLAASRGQIEMVEVILKHLDIEVNALTKSRETALFATVRHGYNDILEVLLQYGADTEIQDWHGGTVLLRAVDFDTLACVRTLVDHHVKCDLKDFLGRGLLHGSAVNNRATILRYVLENIPNMDSSGQGNRGEIQLHDAATRDYDKCVRVLLEYGGRTNILDNAGRSPARVAMDSISHRSLPLLSDARLEETERGRHNKDTMSRSERVNTFGADCEQPIHSAVRFLDREELLAYLDGLGLDEEASINLLDNDLQQTPLHIASRTGKLEAVTWLLDHGAQLNTRDVWGWTPLHLAAKKGWNEVAITLLDRGADVNAMDLCERTPLIFAFNPEVAFTLVQRGATFDKHATHIQRVLIWACEYGELEVAKQLLDAGVSLQQKDIDGLTPYQRAEHAEHEELAAFLLERTEGHLKMRSPFTSRDHVPTLQGTRNDSATETPDVTANQNREEPTLSEAACKDSNKAQNLDTENDTTAEASLGLVADGKNCVGDGIDVVEAKSFPDIAASAIVSNPLRMDKGADIATEHGRSSTLGITMRECALLGVIMLLIAIIFVR
ncbi:hypothetical protein KCV07_g2338, partial [Aureobasidium melanogenum]